MRNKNILFATIALTLISGFTYVISQTKPTTEPKIIQDTVKNVKPVLISLPDSVFTDKGLKLRPYKKTLMPPTMLIVLTVKEPLTEVDSTTTAIQQLTKNFLWNESKSNQ